MSNPYFSVDEEVIVQSNNYPEVNGDNVVLEVITAKEFKSLTLEQGNNVDAVGNYYYRLDIEFNTTYAVSGMESGRTASHMAESALRKKHKPSEKSFAEIMDIKMPVTQ